MPSASSALLTHDGFVELPKHEASGGFDHAAVRSASGHVYVAHRAKSAVDVFDPSSRRHLFSIPHLSGVAGVRRLLRCGLALVLVMAALPTGDRTAHAADSILTEILRRGTVRIATAVATRPLRFEDENGNLQGYEIDIANRLAKDLGVTIDWVKTKSVGRVAMLETKQADITIASFTPNLERLKTIGFTDPYATAQLSLLSRTDRKDLGSVVDFNRPEVKFAIPRGTTMATVIATYAPKATVVEVAGFADMIAALEAGQADAMLIPEAMVNWTAKNSGGKYHNAGAVGPPEEDAIGFPQGDFVWWMWLNRFVREINEDGTNYTLRIKWFGDAPMPAFIKPPPKSG
jgi:polar amino acid transport system substrate-binding protein